MSEGGLKAPVRHPLDWQRDDFHDPGLIDAELRRVFDICHGCRRCFNLCDSFPRLFDLIDEAESGELDTVDSAGFVPVIEACTLCDMCFMTKCPYVPPHEFNLDFPHLMLRYRAAEFRKGKTGFVARQIAETDRNGRLAGALAGLANWATRRSSRLSRWLIEKLTAIDHAAEVPAFHRHPLVERAAKEAAPVNREAPAFGRKAVLYATCFANYNDPAIGLAAGAVLARNGVECDVVYPGCCGMPKLEHGDIEGVAAQARRVAEELGRWIDRGYDIIAPVPSCALMLKFEWPLILPDDAAVKRLSAATSDITEYIVDIARNEGLAAGLGPIKGGIAFHLACHARAQNMGARGAEMLRLIPQTPVTVIERCSGHGGSWGMMKDNFDVALRVGKPVARKALAAVGASSGRLASECPLAGAHIVQGMEKLAPEGGSAPLPARHPIEILAEAYGLQPQQE